MLYIVKFGDKKSDFVVIAKSRAGAGPGPARFMDESEISAHPYSVGGAIRPFLYFTTCLWSKTAIGLYLFLFDFLHHYSLRHILGY
jgi:hypothetical protein